MPAGANVQVRVPVEAPATADDTDGVITYADVVVSPLCAGIVAITGAAHSMAVRLNVFDPEIPEYGVVATTVTDVAEKAVPMLTVITPVVAPMLTPDGAPSPNDHVMAPVLAVAEVAVATTLLLAPVYTVASEIVAITGMAYDTVVIEKVAIAFSPVGPVAFIDALL